MKSYNIINIKDGYKFIVLAISYVNPVDELDEIEKELYNKRFNGKVLFDLLLCNGINKNRYVEINFNGERFDTSSLKLIESITRSSKEIVSEYFKEHPIYIESSVLPKAQCYLMKKGEII